MGLATVVRLRRTVTATGIAAIGIAIGGASSAAPLTIKASAPASALFKQGAETFTILTDKGDTPEFHLLNDTPDKRALALAIISTINADPATQPKLASKQELDVKVKSMTLTPHAKNADYLMISLALLPKVGDDVTLPKLVKKSDFLAGVPIDYDVPKDERNIALFSITSSGHMKFHYDALKSQIVISDANAQLGFDSPLAGHDQEAVHFSGKGVREVTP